jgi:NAD(P)-dependent dehydrogenase (short-subunit alcohol dehydrogenase family)
MIPQIWLIVGASRGIGVEFVNQLLARGDTVIATARAPLSSSTLSSLASSWNEKIDAEKNGENKENEITKEAKRLTVLECDVSAEESIRAFGQAVGRLGEAGGVLDVNGISRGVIDVAVMNAGILEYPGRISEM